MEKDPHTILPSRPAPGGLIRLRAQPTDLSTWLGPAWAALCGVAASGTFSGHAKDWLRLALLVLLVDGGWGTLWTALGSTDWTVPLSRWRRWHFGEPLLTPPYTQPNSPGDRLSLWLGQLRAWWRDVLWPTCGPATSSAAVAVPVTAVLAASLGREQALLSAAALAVIQLNLIWTGGNGATVPLWNSLIGLALPWLAGHAAFGTPSPSSVIMALAFALAQAAAWQAESRWGGALQTGAGLVPALLLVVLHHPLAAACLFLLHFPQLSLLPWRQRGQSASWYVQHTRPWLMLAMLIAAWAL